MTAFPQETPTITSVYSAIDPMQAILRNRLDTLTEDELIAVETDLGYHARTGNLTRRVTRILDALAQESEKLAA